MRRNPIEDVQLPADVIVMIDEAADAGVPVASLYGADGVVLTLDQHMAEAKAYLSAYRGVRAKQRQIVTKLTALLKKYMDEAIVGLGTLAELLGIPSFEDTFNEEAMLQEAYERWRARVRQEEEDAEYNDEERDDENDDELELAVQEEVQGSYYREWVSALLGTADEIYDRYGLKLARMFEPLGEQDRVLPHAVRVTSNDWLQALGEMGVDIEDTDLEEAWEPNDQVSARDYVLRHLGDIRAPRGASAKRMFQGRLR